jgi:phosphatidylinositol alpha-1,6-mannosyltransferase
MQPSTRVLVLTPALDGADGISEVSRQTVAAIATAWGVQSVEVWALDGGQPPDGPRVAFRSAGGVKTRFIAWALARAGAANADLLVLAMHVHLAPAALTLAVRGARLAIFFHGIEVWQPLRARDRAAVARASTLIANSQWTARRFHEANPGIAAAPVAICHLGVSRMGAPGHAGVFRDDALIVGRLSSEERYKGHDALIRLWPRVRDAVPSARLVVVGDGDDRPRLEALTAASGMADAIEFTGRVSNETLAARYRDAALFVMPSTGEGFGLAYLEAMQAGKACIAAPGAAAEIVEDGVSGLIVDPTDDEMLVAAIVRLFRQPRTREAMGRAGAARVFAHFSEGDFARRLLHELGAPVVVPA